MSNLRASFEQIDEYLNGELTGQELAEFKEMMEKHESLAEEVRLQQLANEAIVELNLADLRKDLKRISLQQKTTSLYKIYGSIATGVLIISGIIFFMMSGKPEETKFPNANIVHPSIEKNSFPQSNAQLPVKAKAGHNPGSTDITAHIQTNIDRIEQEEPEKITLQGSTDSIRHISNYFTHTVHTTELKTEPTTVENTLQSNASPCKTEAIDAFIHIEPACKDQKGSGKITIDLASVKGGKPGYQFSLNDGNDYQAFPVFDQLASGPAQLLIKDAQGCISRKLLSIPEKNCFKEIVIHPSQGETWTSPIISKENVITISDPQGNIQFEYHYTHFDNFAWDGKASDGQDLPMGQYYYTIRGDKGNIINGYISIIR